MRLVIGILRRNKVDGIVDRSTRPPTLYVESLSRVRGADRRILGKLVRRKQLLIRASGSIDPLAGPEIPDETVPTPPTNGIYDTACGSPLSKVLAATHSVLLVA